MKRHFFALIVIILCVNFIHAQNHKLWGRLEVGDGFTIGKKYESYYRTTSSHTDMSFIRAELGYYVTPDVSVGVMIGINSYPVLNIIPLGIDIKMHPFTNKNIIINGDGGISISTNEDNMKGKSIIDLSAGYKLSVRKICIIPSIGYNYCHYEVTGNDNLSHYDSYHSVFLKVGFAY